MKTPRSAAHAAFFCAVSVHLLLAAQVIAGEPGSHDPLRFDPRTGGIDGSVQVYGKTVQYTEYKAVPYVSRPNDPVRQVMNIFVPRNATQKSPIFMGLKTGAFLEVQTYLPTEVTAANINQSSTGVQGIGVAHAAAVLLSKGVVVVTPGARGQNVQTTVNGVTYEIGNGPAALVDLKAAVRYLKYNDKVMLGDANKIIVSGASGGGAMSSALGATGDSPIFDADLKAIGAAPTSDSVFAASPFCPIIDLDNANMEYEYHFYKAAVPGWANHAYTEEDLRLHLEGAKLFPAYINGLGLKDPATGKVLTLSSYESDPSMGGTYKDYVVKALGASITKFMVDSKFVNADGTLNAAGSKYMTTKGRGTPLGTPELGTLPPGPLPGASPGDPSGEGGGRRVGLADSGPRLPDPAADMAPGDFIAWNASTKSANLTDYAKFAQFMARLRPVMAFDNGFFNVGLENNLFNVVPSIFNPTLATGGWSHFDVNLAQTMVNAHLAGSKGFSSIYNYVVPEAVMRWSAMMNPLFYVADQSHILGIKVNPFAAAVYGSSKPARYWRIRVGSFDTQSSPFVSLNLATALANQGAKVDYKIWWNTGHTGSYDNTDLIAWIEGLPGVTIH